ncbi:MAG: class I SAM-dependent methyltransferase [Myxococcota bacterium]
MDLHPDDPRLPVQALFDRWADNGRAEGMEEGHTPTAREAFERLHLTPGDSYLDIGCGNGYSVRWAAQLDPSIRATGLDLSPQMVARAREQSSKHPNTRFIHAPFPLPMLRDGAFNAIFSMEVFYYLPDLSVGLREVARLLAPGGRFVCIIDFYEENTASHSWPEDVGVQMNLMPESMWRAAMTYAGLEVLEQTRLRHPLPEGEAPSWKQTEGSLMTLARRRPTAPPTQSDELPESA